MSITSEDTRAGVEWERWHAEREADLATDYGWLSLTGFAWLAAEPTAVDGLPGLWWDDHGTARLRVGTADAVTVDGQVVNGDSTAAVDEGGSVEWVEVGTTHVQLLRRGGRLAVRSRDPQAPTRTGFEGVPTFAYDPAWVVEGRFTRDDEPSLVEVATARADLRQHVRIAGSLAVSIGEDSHTLRVGENADGTLHVLFHDATNGTETALWRSVTTHRPGPDGDVLIDLNRAVNLPYAFTDFGTCPAPPEVNRLPVRVTAGERAPA